MPNENKEQKPQKIRYGKSTVAMQVYQFLCIHGTMSRDDAYAKVSGVLHSVSREFFDASVDELIRRGWVFDLSDRGDGIPSCLELVDYEKRRMPVRRDLSDAMILESGEPAGGWSGWRCAPKMTPIEKIIEEVQG